MSGIKTYISMNDIPRWAVRKTYDIIGYALNGTIYCPDCLTNAEKDIAVPVFADSEFDSPQCCDQCGETIDVNIIGICESNSNI